jgi:hypothetical protein
MAHTETQSRRLEGAGQSMANMRQSGDQRTDDHGSAVPDSMVINGVKSAQFSARRL